VGHVVEGSVRKVGNRVRITAQLIEALSDSHLWSETYDRKLDDIFAIQDEISAAIVAALKERLGLQLEAVPRVTAPANTEAHDAYLRGRYLVVQRARATVEGAVREFEKAILVDPDYALAHAELAIAILLLITSGDLTVTEAIARAIPHVERAMALDPNLAEAHAATGFLLWKQRNLEEALNHFERAIELNPNYSMAYYWMAFLFGEYGRYDEEFTMVQTTLRLDPLAKPAYIYYTNLLTLRNRLDEAYRELEKIALIYPGIYAGAKGELAGVGGKWANIVLGILEALRIEPDRVVLRSYLAMLFALIDLEGEVFAMSETARDDWRLLNMLGKSGDAVTVAEARLTEKSSHRRACREDLGLALAAAGDYARARPILEELWQHSGGLVTVWGEFSANCAAALITIRHDAGDEAGIGELLVAMRDDVRRSREAGMTGAKWEISTDYEEGLAAYLAGERDRGLALIAKAAEDGYFILPNEAYLQTLYDDPDFAPIRAGQEARQARERNKFLAIVCTDNPYEEVWQPAEGTCEQFATEGGN